MGSLLHTISLKSPLTGKVVPLDAVPDQVFAQRMVGDGVAVDPSEGLVVTPVDARVETVFPSGHAILLRTQSNVTILVHIGIGSVRLAYAFEKMVEAGAEVKEGDVLLRFDLEAIRREAESTMSPVIILDPPPGLSLRHTAPCFVEAGKDPLFSVVLPGSSHGLT
ncbi:MAG: PTS glucose transporter subunit IIA [Firmicutes bacterium]|nr:PTS glucose transporter subunit IIA [Bacillota bacterium]